MYVSNKTAAMQEVTLKPITPTSALKAIPPPQLISDRNQIPHERGTASTMRLTNSPILGLQDPFTNPFAASIKRLDKSMNGHKAIEASAALPPAYIEIRAGLTTLARKDETSASSRDPQDQSACIARIESSRAILWEERPMIIGRGAVTKLLYAV